MTDTPEATPAVAPPVTVDVASITLAEMAAIEQQSGRPFHELLVQGSATRRMIALHVQASRSAEPMTWQAIGSLRLGG